MDARIEGAIIVSVVTLLTQGTLILISVLRARSKKENAVADQEVLETKFQQYILDQATAGTKTSQQLFDLLIKIHELESLEKQHQEELTRTQEGLIKARTRIQKLERQVVELGGVIVPDEDDTFATKPKT